MIIYFADRKMNILGRASTNLPKGIRITDDLKTEEVEVGVKVFECDLSYTSGNQKTIKNGRKPGIIFFARMEKKQNFIRSSIQKMIQRTVSSVFMQKM